MMYYKNSDGSFSPIAPRINDAAPSDKTTYSGNKVEEIASNLADNTAVSSTATGINPTITDSADGYVQDLTVYGRTDTVEGELHGIGEDGEVDVVTCGKNLIDANDITLTAPYYVIQPLTPLWLPAGQMTFSFDFSGESSTAQFLLSNNSYNTADVVFTVISGHNIINVNNMQDSSKITFFSNAIGTYSNFQLERGFTATAYEPYVSTSATVTTGIPLYSVGDVKDELDEKKGVVVKRCGKKNLDDLEWTLASLNRWASYISDIKPIATNTDIVNVISDYTAVSANALIADETLNGIALNTGGNILVRNGSTTNPPTGDIVYELAEPYEIPLSASEIARLRYLHTYNLTTNVTITDNPTVDISYLLSTDNGQAVADVQSELCEDIVNRIFSDQRPITLFSTAWIGNHQKVRTRVIPLNGFLYNGYTDNSVMKLMTKHGVRLIDETQNGMLIFKCDTIPSDFRLYHAYFNNTYPLTNYPVIDKAPLLTSVGYKDLQMVIYQTSTVRTFYEPQNVFTKVGLLSSPNSVITDESTVEQDLVCGGAKVSYERAKSGADVQSYSVYEYSWTKSNVNVGDIWYSRAFMQYIDGTTGQEITVYDKVVKIYAGQDWEVLG